MATTPQIGALTFLILDGRVQPMAGDIRVAERDGIDGHEAYQIGERGPISTLRTIKRFSSASDLKSHEDASAALRIADPLTVIYMDGQSRSNVQVENVVTTAAKYSPVVVASGSGNYLIKQTWSVRQVSS